jgi:hypothetical protein
LKLDSGQEATAEILTRKQERNVPNHQGLGCLRSSRLISGDSQRGVFLPHRNEGCGFLEPLNGVFVGDPSQCESQYSEGLSEVRKGNDNACNGGNVDILRFEQLSEKTDISSCFMLE